MTLPREQHCARATVDTLREVSSPIERPRSILVACRKEFARRPNWAAVLRELEAHHVWTLPDDSELPPPSLILNDGTLMEIEAWDGRRYRSYGYSNPGIILAPESEDAGAIQVRADSLAR